MFALSTGTWLVIVLVALLAGAGIALFLQTKLRSAEENGAKAELEVVQEQLEQANKSFSTLHDQFDEAKKAWDVERHSLQAANLATKLELVKTQRELNAIRDPAVQRNRLDGVLSSQAVSGEGSAGILVEPAPLADGVPPPPAAPAAGDPNGATADPADGSGVRRAS